MRTAPQRGFSVAILAMSPCSSLLIRGRPECRARRFHVQYPRHAVRRAVDDAAHVPNDQLLNRLRTGVVVGVVRGAAILRGDLQTASGASAGHSWCGGLWCRCGLRRRGGSRRRGGLRRCGGGGLGGGGRLGRPWLVPAAGRDCEGARHGKQDPRGHQARSSSAHEQSVIRSAFGGYNAKRNLRAKVLDFVQSGGPKRNAS